jgi:hypothetical protein
MNGNRGKTIMVGVGIALVVGFFLPWIDLIPGHGVSGWDLVRSSQVSLITRMLFALCPLGGVAMIVAGLGGGRAASGVAMGTGGLILGYTAYKLGYFFIKVTGVGLWLILAAAIVALIAGLVYRKS